MILVAGLLAACSTTKPEPEETILGPLRVILHPNAGTEPQSALRAAARQLGAEQCAKHGRVPEWLAEEFRDNAREILLTIYCVEPGANTTEEQKQARIANMREYVARGRMTQNAFDQAQAVVLSEP